MSHAPVPFTFGHPTWPGLAKIVEEAGETAQVIGKLYGSAGAEVHFDGTNLRERLTDELADLRAAIDFAVDHNGLDVTHMEERTAAKRAQFEGWHLEHGAGNSMVSR